MQLFYSIFGFILAIGILVTIHEFGHFWVARRAGVKVLRFSVGFGKPLKIWRRKNDETEYVLAAIPLGGYVKMLDERVEEVSEADKPRAFNRQSLLKRTAIVAAGPLANFLFAISWIYYTIVFINNVFNIFNKALRCTIDKIYVRNVMIKSVYPLISS